MSKLYNIKHPSFAGENGMSREDVRKLAESAEPLSPAQAAALYLWIGDGGEESPADYSYERECEIQATNMDQPHWIGETFAHSRAPWLDVLIEE